MKKSSQIAVSAMTGLLAGAVGAFGILVALRAIPDGLKGFMSAWRST